MKKIDDAPLDVIAEFMNGVEAQVNKKQGGGCHCCEDVGPE